MCSPCPSFLNVHRCRLSRNVETRAFDVRIKAKALRQRRQTREDLALLRLTFLGATSIQGGGDQEEAKRSGLRGFADVRIEERTRAAMVSLKSEQMEILRNKTSSQSALTDLAIPALAYSAT